MENVQQQMNHYRLFTNILEITPLSTYHIFKVFEVIYSKNYT